MAIFLEISQKVLLTMLLGGFFWNSKMANSPKKINCCRSFHQVDYLILFNFVRLVDWRSSTRGLSQTWLQITQESRNFWVPHYIFATNARSSSLNLAISPFFPSKYGDVGNKIPRKNLCMKKTLNL